MSTNSNLFTKDFLIIAGPCAVESEHQILAAAEATKKAGAHVMRAGLWKPRSTPDAWDGVKAEGIPWMIKARKQFKIPIMTEIRGESQIKEIIKAKFDIVWIGSRNGQNQDLIEAVGKAAAEAKTPVLLKRAMAADLREWVGPAGFITKYTSEVFLCERGIKGFPRETRNVLDLQTAWLAKMAGYKVIIDVSHAAGRRDLIRPMARAVKAAGFDGIMIETDEYPDKAKTDSAQQVTFQELTDIINELKTIPLGTI